jgi:hypothetical protein
VELDKLQKQVQPMLPEALSQLEALNAEIRNTFEQQMSTVDQRDLKVEDDLVQLLYQRILASELVNNRSWESTERLGRQELPTYQQFGFLGLREEASQVSGKARLNLLCGESRKTGSH